MRPFACEDDIGRDLLRLLEIRRRQVISAFVTGSEAGMCVIELLRVLKVVPEPIGWAIAAGMLAIPGVIALVSSEVSLRKQLSRIAPGVETPFQDSSK